MTDPFTPTDASDADIPAPEERPTDDECRCDGCRCVECAEAREVDA